MRPRQHWIRFIHIERITGEFHARRHAPGGNQCRSRRCSCITVGVDLAAHKCEWQQDVAALLQYLCKARIHAIFCAAEQGIEQHHAWLALFHVADQFRPHPPRPRPSTQLLRKFVEAGVIDIDNDDIAVGAAIQRGASAYVRRAVFQPVQPPGGRGEPRPSAISAVTAITPVRSFRRV
jgi:hypothetical protein